MIESVADFILILREVHFHFWLHVKSNESNVILWLQVREERVGPVFRQIGELAVVACAELHHNHHGDGRFGGTEVGDRLWNAIFKQAKIFALEAADDVAMVCGGDDVHGDDGNFNGDRESAFLRLLRGRSLRRRRCWLRLPAGLRSRGRLRQSERNAECREHSAQKEPTKSVREYSVHSIPQCYPACGTPVADGGT